MHKVRAFIRAKHQHALRQLAPFNVRIPYATWLRFPDTNLVARRAFQQLLGMIRAVALLRQRQKVVQAGEIDADWWDYRFAHRIMAPVIARSFTPMKPKVRLLLNQIIAHCSPVVDTTGRVTSCNEFTRKDCETWVGVGQTTVRDRLAELVEAGYVIQDGRGRGAAHRYRLARVAPSVTGDGALLTSPEELWALLQQSAGSGQRTSA